MHVITPTVIASILGSLIGSYVNFDTERYGIRLTLLMTLLTCSAAAASAEHLALKVTDISIFAYFLLGGFIGLFGLSLLDAMRLAMPNFTRNLVNGITETLVTSMIDLVVTIFDTIKSKITIFNKNKDK